MRFEWWVWVDGRGFCGREGGIGKRVGDACISEFLTLKLSKFMVCSG